MCMHDLRMTNLCPFFVVVYHVTSNDELWINALFSRPGLKTKKHVHSETCVEASVVVETITRPVTKPVTSPVTRLVTGDLDSETRIVEVNFSNQDAYGDNAYVDPTLTLNNDGAHRNGQSENVATLTPPTTSDDNVLVTEDSQSPEALQGDTPILPDVHPRVDDSAVSSEAANKKTKITYRQKIIFISAALATFSTWLTYSIIAVFFPTEAQAKGMSQTVTGLVFSAYSFAATIGAPIWGKIIPVVGARFVFLAGAFVTGVCNVLFGFIVDMPTVATFTGFCFTIRIIEGLGSSACSTATSAIMAYTFPDNIGTAMGLFEMVSGVSFAIGPAIGGLIYNAGGFKLPFFVLGGLVLATFSVNFFLMPKIGSKNEKTGSMIKVLSIPAIWISMFAVFAGLFGLSAMDPTLSVHLKKLDFTVVETSLMFASLGTAYALTSVFWGIVVDKKRTTRIIMILGAYGCAITFLFLGPSPLLNISSTKLVPSLVIPIGSCTLAMTTVPTMLDMLISAEWYGMPINLGLTGVVSGLWSSSTALGTMLGPLLGAGLTEKFGFAYATTIIACGYIVVMLAICFFGIWEYRCGKGRRLPKERLAVEASSTEEERAALLSNETEFSF